MILYHYCTSETFLKILESRSVWACEVSLANDSLEGQWINNLAKNYKPAKRLVLGHREKFLRQFERLAQFTAFTLCLSERGDLLSQWRAYAHDASGFSIGFGKEFLTDFENGGSEGYWYFDKVNYNEPTQLERVADKFDAILKEIESGAFDLPLFGLLLDATDREQKKKDAANKQAAAELAIRGHLADLVPLMFFLKNPAFEEELEWRLFRMFLNKNVAESYKGLNFAARADRIVPYATIGLDPSKNPIKEVYLGPRNATPDHIVKGMLTHFGYQDVTIHRSAASYR